MLYSVILSFLSVFAVCGITLLVKEGVKYLLHKQISASYVVMSVKEKEENIEPVLRSLLLEYPRASIFVITPEEDVQNNMILSKMEKDDARVHPLIRAAGGR
jgi:hypothetical protein